jgi:hypothetical protein
MIFKYHKDLIFIVTVLVSIIFETYTGIAVGTVISIFSFYIAIDAWSKNQKEDGANFR